MHTPHAVWDSGGISVGLRKLLRCLRSYLALAGVLDLLKGSVSAAFAVKVMQTCPKYRGSESTYTSYFVPTFFMRGVGGGGGCMWRVVTEIGPLFGTAPEYWALYKP